MLSPVLTGAAHWDLAPAFCGFWGCPNCARPRDSDTGNAKAWPAARPPGAYEEGDETAGQSWREAVSPGGVGGLVTCTQGLWMKDEVPWRGLGDSGADFVLREGVPGGEQNVQGIATNLVA